MRDPVLDIVKGIGIVLVIVGHLPMGMGGGNISIPYASFFPDFRNML